MRSHSSTTSTKGDEFRRIEVITGVGRRRRWTDEEKAWIVAESLDPATTVSAVARRYGLHASRHRLSRPPCFLMCYGPEFAGKALDQGTWLNGVELGFSQPGKPTDNALIEAFNGRPRAECLNASWFLSLADARDRIEAWRRDYNEERPHSALGSLTLRTFTSQAHSARRVA